VLGNEPQRLQVAVRELAIRCEQLGSRSEVERFRVEPGHWLLVEALPSRKAAQLLDQLGVGAAVARADTDVDTRGGPLPVQVVRPARARVHPQSQGLRSAPGKDLDLRHDPRADAVTDEVGHSLLQVEGVRYTADVASSVLDADEQRSARRVGEGHDRLEHSVRRRHVAFELERLPLRALQDLEEVHARK